MKRVTPTKPRWARWIFQNSKFASLDQTRRLCWENGTCSGKRETSAASSHWFFRNFPKAGVSFTTTRRKVRPKQNNNLIWDLPHLLADQLISIPVSQSKLSH